MFSDMADPNIADDKRSWSLISSEMKLWLVPAADARATANVPKTLSQPISEARRSSAGLSAETARHAWGARSGARNDNTLQTMNSGDLANEVFDEMRRVADWIQQKSDGA